MTASQPLHPRAPALRLTELPRGVAARVIAIVPARRGTLAAHGVRLGSLVEVDGDAPFRGPRIVRLGRARLAISRVVARDVTVVPLPAGLADAPAAPTAPG